jgi:predicted permease
LFTLPEFRHAARGLARTPTVAASAVLCLALGIGATTAIASAVSRALLHELPFRESASLVAVHRVTPQSGPFGTWPFSAPNFTDLAARARRTQPLAAIAQGTALVALRSEAVQASQLYVTGNLFPMLGLRAAQGRLVLPSDDRADQPPVAVLSEEFWRSRLGADPAVVGSSIMIDGEPTTIVGIAPRDLRIPHGGNVLRADVWMPIRFTPANLSSRRANYLQVLGRLAPGATVETADAEARELFGRIVEENPVLRGDAVRVAALQPENVASIRKPLLLLFGAVVAVLLIACTNVAALLLARGVQRRREMAVRTAIGATRWGTMRVALAESLLITAIGTALGIALAFVGVRTIGTLAAARIPQLAGLTLDGRVLGFALALAAVVAVACAAVPAWRAAGVDPQEALRGGRGGGAGRSHHRALRLLVGGEIATSLVLLIGAGLVLKAFAQLLSSDPGFAPERVLTLRVTTSPARYANQSSTRGFLAPALDAVQAIPGVEAAASISSMPYVSWGNNTNVRYEGMPKDEPTRLPIVEMRRVSPSFFAVTGQRLLSGRTLRDADDETAPVVVVVNRALVERDFKGQEAVGKRFHLTDSTYGTIVGVVADIRNVGPLAPPAPEFYQTVAQAAPGAASFPLMVRVRGDDPAAVAPQVRAAIRRLDPTAAVADVQPMPEVITASLGRPRFYLSLLGTFAVVAIVLAVAGLYGVLSYAVAQRTREFGIQLALGSPPRALLRRVAAQGVVLVAGGLAAGLVGAMVVTRLLEFMLYGVSPLDVTTWIAATALLLAAGVLAALVPAQRATRVDPVRALQAE